jgi:outer membrane protein assembly factor BamB
MNALFQALLLITALPKMALAAQEPLREWPAEGPKKLWSVSISPSMGTFSGPVPVGGKLFVLGRNGTKDVVKCLSADSGKTLWNYEYDAPGAVSYGSGPRARPIVAADRVYTSNAFNRVFCFDAETGVPLWDRDLGKELRPAALGFGAAAAPLILGDLLVCQPGASAAGAGIVALDRKTGKDVWKCAEGSASYAAPQRVTLCGVEQILVYAKNVAGIDPKSGRVLWSYLYEDGKNVAAPMIIGDRVIAGNLSWGVGCRKIVQTGGKWSVLKEWANADVRMCSNSPVLEDGHLYFFDDQARLVGMDVRDGAIKWALQTRPHKLEEHANGLLLAPHHLLLNFEDGVVALYEVSPSGGKVKSSFQAVKGPYAMAPAAIASGRLFVRDSLVLSCFDLTTK